MKNGNWKLWIVAALALFVLSPLVAGQHEDWEVIEEFDKEMMESGLLCPADRRLGLKDPSEECPGDLNGWEAVPLFGGLDDPDGDQGGQGTGSGSLAGDLRSFCLYRRTEEGAPPPPRTEPDCLAIGPADIDRRVELVPPPELAHAFDRGAGRLQSPLPAPEGSRPRLVFIDVGPSGPSATLPPPALFDFGQPVTGEPLGSNHAASLMLMAHRLLRCGDPLACAVRLRSLRALGASRLFEDGRIARLRSDDRAGQFGAGGAMVIAIEEAVLDAEADKVPLVLNLSLGWNGQRWGGYEKLPREMPLRFRAVYHALELAACKDAIIVAAAGNFVGGPGTDAEMDDPLLPAGWAPRRVGPARCGGLGTVTADRPLLWAAGALDRYGRPLLIRDDAFPPLVAYADHAVARRPGGGGWSEELTGSSVATTVVSTAAAALWSTDLSLSANAVMASLNEEPTDSAVTRSFCPSGGCGNAGRVRVCRAVGKPCPPDGPSTVAGVELAEDEGAYSDTLVTGGECHSETVKHNGAQPAEPCPHWTYHAIEDNPTSGPQPGDNPCDSCQFNPGGSGLLVVDLDDDFSVEGEPLTEVRSLTLLVDGTTQTAELAARQCIAGTAACPSTAPDADPQTYALDDTIVSEDDCPPPAMEISMVVVGASGTSYSKTSPVLVQSTVCE